MRLIHIYSIGLSALLALKNTDTIHCFPVHNFQPPPYSSHTRMQVQLGLLPKVSYSPLLHPQHQAEWLIQARGQEALVGLYLGRYFYMDAHYIRLCECCVLNFVPEIDLGDCGYTL